MKRKLFCEICPFTYRLNSDCVLTTNICAVNSVPRNLSSILFIFMPKTSTSLARTVPSTETAKSIVTS